MICQAAKTSAASIVQCQQVRVPTNGGDVVRYGAFQAEPLEVVGSARLGTGAGKRLAAERLSRGLIHGIDLARAAADWSAIDAYSGARRRNVRLAIPDDLDAALRHVTGFFGVTRPAALVAAIAAAAAVRDGNVLAKSADKRRRSRAAGDWSALDDRPAAATV